MQHHKLKKSLGVKLGVLGLFIAMLLTFLFGSVQNAPANTKVKADNIVTTAEVPALTAPSNSKTIKVTSSLDSSVKTFTIDLDNENNSYIKYYEMFGGFNDYLNCLGANKDFYEQIKNKDGEYYSFHKDAVKQGYFMPLINLVSFAKYFYPDKEFIEYSEIGSPSSAYVVKSATINGKEPNYAYRCNCVRENFSFPAPCSPVIHMMMLCKNLDFSHCVSLEFPPTEDITIHLDIERVLKVKITNLNHNLSYDVPLNDSERVDGNYVLTLNSLINKEVFGKDFHLGINYKSFEFKITNVVEHSTGDSGLKLTISPDTVAKGEAITISYRNKLAGAIGDTTKTVVDGVGSFFSGIGAFFTNLFSGIGGFGNVISWLSQYGVYILLGIAGVVVVVFVIKLIKSIFN